ncbi:MAG TPA: glycosyltransferase [Terriglobales bacterium]|nr:glycosyltransferase [Terriglobales bacterium]
MRILYCNKYNFRFSGTEAYLFETMELMRSRGHEVALFSMADERGAANAYDRYLVPHTDFKSSRGIVSKARLAVHSIYSSDARRRISRLIEEFKPDVTHVRNIYHHLSPSILWELKSQGVPVLYHLNDFKMICPSYNLVSNGKICERCAGGKFWNVVREGCYAGGRAASAVLAAEAYFHRFISTYEKCVDLILAPSIFAKHKLIENGWHQSRIKVLPHFQNRPLRSSPYPGRNAPILYFGRLSAEKGIDDLLLAMQKLPYIELVVAGDGPKRLALEAFVRERQLKNISFLGYVNGSALEKLIANSVVTIFPSRAYETMGKSILESYAQGRAVIASDLGSRRELVTHGKTGLLYAAGNVEQLSSAIALLHERPELAKEMGEAGRELLSRNHSQKEHLQRLERIYGSLTQKRTAFPKQHSPFAASDPTGKPIRIAFIGGRGVIGKYSGIETYYEEVGERLAKLGHKVTVYCRSHFTPAIAEYRGIRLVRFPTLRTKHLETLVHTFLSTVHACFSDCEIVHYHTLGPSIFACLPRLFGKKTVVTVQGLDWKRAKWRKFARIALKLGEWSSARLPNKTIVVSRTLQRYYISRYEKECAYVPNGTQLRSRQANCGSIPPRL